MLICKCVKQHERKENKSIWNLKKSKILLKEIYDGLLTRKKELKKDEQKDYVDSETIYDNVLLLSARLDAYYTAYFIYEEVFGEES